jgi:hypothetical protein
MAWEAGIFFSIMVFMAFLTWIGTMTPPEYQIISPFSFATLGASLIGVAGACAIATGLPCAGALAVFGVFDMLAQYFTTTFDWVKLLIFTPISMLLLYLAIRLARGGG